MGLDGIKFRVEQPSLLKVISDVIQQKENKIHYFCFLLLIKQSGRTEAPTSTIPPVLQRCSKSMYLVQLLKSGKYASNVEVLGCGLSYFEWT